ncbi:MAG: hypothetical protein H8D43_03370 [Chloroflexi bacterium]|nr:hypothetical protein [Chloroflexota bacterium]
MKQVDEAALARELIMADDPLAALFAALSQVWQADDVDDVNTFFTKRERETNRLERFVLETYFDVYDLLLARVRQERERSRFEATNGPLIILDGCSIREANLLIGRLQEAGYQITDYSYALSEVPSSTMAFNRSAFGTARVASLQQWRQYQVVSIESGKLPALFPAVSDVLVWISYPDELLHKVRGEAVTPQEAFDKTVKVLLTTLDGLGADEFLVTSDHGYLYVENATLFWSAGRDVKVLRQLFGGRRAVLAGKVGPEFDKLRQVPRSRTYALFDDEGCYVQGRYHWSVQGPASDIAHGGISLMECLVPVMRIRREK